jgi:hypothetical protein
VRVVEERPFAVGTASLFGSRAMAYAVLPSVRSRTTRATTSWRRPWSPEDDTVVASHGQRIPRAASDEVALELREDHSHVRHRLPIGVPHRVVPSQGRRRLTRLPFPGWCRPRLGGSRGSVARWLE